MIAFLCGFACVLSLIVLANIIGYLFHLISNFSSNTSEPFFQMFFDPINVVIGFLISVVIGGALFLSYLLGQVLIYKGIINL